MRAAHLRDFADALAPADDPLRTHLVDTINHELRTPLTTVLGHAELLQDLQLDLPELDRTSHTS